MSKIVSTWRSDDDNKSKENHKEWVRKGWACCLDCVDRQDSTRGFKPDNCFIWKIGGVCPHKES